MTKDTITILDKQFVKFIDGADIDKAVQRIADQINADYQGDKPVLIITLNGAVVFAVDLLKRLTVDCQITCIRLSSYAGLKCTNHVNSLIGLTDDLRGRRVIVVEDIVDTGNTYVYINAMLRKQGVRDLRMATMTIKEDVYDKELPVHYVGFSIPDRFVVGRGLDYNGYGRNLNDIYRLCDGQ